MDYQASSCKLIKLIVDLFKNKKTKKKAIVDDRRVCGGKKLFNAGYV